MLAYKLFRIGGYYKEINLNNLYASKYPGKQFALEPMFLYHVLVSKHHELNAITYGGFLEDRTELWSGHYHEPGHVIHLGVDYNVPLATVVTLPVDAKLICIDYDEDQNGGWGYRMIFKYDDIYITFAHLTPTYFNFGDVSKRTVIGYVSDCEVNGGWYPHLHVQCMKVHDLSIDGYGDEELAKQMLDPEVVL